MIFEARHENLISRPRFLRRLLTSWMIGGALAGGALSMGVMGYHWIGGLPWVDAFLNASMIFSGMGPVDPLPTDAAKIFASCFALFSGVVFISSVGVALSPVVHRAIHKFHLDGRGSGRAKREE